MPERTFQKNKFEKYQQKTKNLAKFHRRQQALCILCCPCFFFSFADFFFKFLRMPSKCQAERIKNRPDTVSGFILVQTVCKSYQQMTLAGKMFNNSIKVFRVTLELGVCMMIVTGGHRMPKFCTGELAS